MGALSTKLRSITSHYQGVERKAIAHWCPGCGHAHTIWTHSPGKPEWQWDGNAEAPTVSPSVRLFWPAVPARPGVPERPESTRCHYFLKAGQIAFCADSAHSLKGQTVPLPDWPEGWGDGDELKS